jgi:hypothetical protein
MYGKKIKMNLVVKEGPWACIILLKDAVTKVGD